MTDVPELDWLLEEHRNFRKNVAFMRRERLFLGACRIALAAMIVTCVGVVVGQCEPLTIPLAWAMAGRFVPKPEWRDPFKRYRYM